MSCETIDLKEFFFEEGTREGRRLVQQHLEACPHCREELSRLQMTQAALGALRDEELPRRIAFVSDKVFEPRWYERLWNSSPRLGFIGASLLAGAILVHAFVPRPVAAPPAQAPTVVAQVSDPAAMEREINSRVEAAVTKAVAESEIRQQQKTVELIKATNQQREMEKREILTAVAARFEFIQKAMNRDYAMASGLGERAMRPLPLLLVASTALAFASGADSSRVPRARILNVEKIINTQIASMFPEEPYFLLGTARGMYLEGYGAVFSAEVNLAMGPSLSPFKPSVTKEEIARHHEKKESRLPALRDKMFTVVGNMASFLEMLPNNEELVFAVTLLHYPWEDTTGQPSQIVMRVQRAKLMEAQRVNAKPDSVVRVQEY